MPTNLLDLPTPCLLLDRARMTRNIDRLTRHLRSLGVPLRPHVKTAKSIDVARQIRSDIGPITVSTLKEAEQFAAAGARDILYAVGIAPGKLARCLALRRSGVDLTLTLDNLEQAEAVVAASRSSGDPIPVLIEIDSDGHRAGIRPGDPLLLELGRRLHAGGAQLRGVMTHAGGSYDCRSDEALIRIAEQERSSAVSCAQALREAGLPAPVVSIGSTPTAHFARSLEGVTEVRAGVFVFFDLVMAGIGVCTLDDIAISVLATVIGHHPATGGCIIDAGWMALSRDRGTAKQPIDRGYGLVCDVAGRPIDSLIVKQTNQEHGIVEPAEANTTVATPPVGTRVRILPNHACATAAQHDRYIVLDEQQHVSAEWLRFSGW